MMQRRLSTIKTSRTSTTITSLAMEYLVTRQDMTIQLQKVRLLYNLILIMLKIM